MYGACAATNIPTHCALCYFLQWLFVREPIRFKESFFPPTKTQRMTSTVQINGLGGAHICLFIYLCIYLNIENILVGYCVIQEFL